MTDAGGAGRRADLGMAPPSPHFSWRRVGLALYVGVNVGLLLALDIVGDHRADWELWRAVPNALGSGILYHTETGLPFLWSPVLAPLIAAVGIIGPLPWAIVHLSALALLRDWRLIALVLVSLGFWTNVAGGNTFTFVFVAGVLALRGSRRWALVYLALLFLMPRPVQIPLALLLLWRQPEVRLPAAGLFVLHGIAVMMTGYAGEWIDTLLSLDVPPWSVGPSHWLGLWWLAIGIPLGLVLLWRGHPGWAGLAWSSYWVPAYFLMPLVEDHRRLAGPAAVAGSTSMATQPAPPT